jgi:hypothetical protein
MLKIHNQSLFLHQSKSTIENNSATFLIIKQSKCIAKKKLKTKERVLGHIRRKIPRKWYCMTQIKDFKFYR